MIRDEADVGIGAADRRGHRRDARLAAGPPRLSPEAEELQKRFPYPVIRDQRGVVPPGPRPLPSPPLGDGQWVFSTLEQRDIKVSVVTRGLSHPWSLAFLPDGSLLVTERIRRLRIVRNCVLEPAEIRKYSVPAEKCRGNSATASRRAQSRRASPIAQVSGPVRLESPILTLNPGLRQRLRVACS
jgi:hypothetical protein